MAYKLGGGGDANHVSKSWDDTPSMSWERDFRNQSYDIGDWVRQKNKNQYLQNLYSLEEIRGF